MTNPEAHFSLAQSLLHVISNHSTVFTGLQYSHGSVSQLITPVKGFSSEVCSQLVSLECSQPGHVYVSVLLCIILSAALTNNYESY